jgi:deoxyribodipyrimidine photo-lyase
MQLSYERIIQQVKDYDSSRYHSTRNYTNGAVTAWSPYISRGLLSPVFIMEILKSKYSKQAWLGFMQQMAWREYFQRVWQAKGNMILQDLKTPQANQVLPHSPNAIISAATSITAIDKAIQDLYKEGYLHNHLRMYISMLHSNIFKAAWLPGAKWMYAHLLDHDPAANYLSWQWVAGTSSSKQYVANQENINKYTGTNQRHTFLDTAYENLTTAIFDATGQLRSTYKQDWIQPVDPITALQQLDSFDSIIQSIKFEIFDVNKINTSLPYCIYNSFNLDPLWHKKEQMNRILLLEPNHFETFPVTQNVMQFIIDLAFENINGLQIFVGNFEALKSQLNKLQTDKHEVEVELSKVLYYKEHPTTLHYEGIQEDRDLLFPEVSGYFPSFFGYWKKCEKYLK